MDKVGRILIAIVVTVTALGQNLKVVVPAQPKASPATQPEPRFRVAEDPLVIFQNLIGSSVLKRRRAIANLGWKEEERFADARFYKVNLDEDPEMEAILRLDDLLGRDTRILIFKKTGGQWWCIGIFHGWYMWGTYEAEHMLELRDIAGFGYKDILIRLTSGGTDIQKAVDVSIYRVYQGRLYRTFGMTEEFALRKYPSPGVMMIDDERHHIYYPDADQREEAYIVVNSSKERIPASEWAVFERSPKIIDCVPYRWDPIQYSFVADKSTSDKFCQPAPQH